MSCRAICCENISTSFPDWGDNMFPLQGVHNGAVSEYSLDNSPHKYDPDSDNYSADDSCHMSQVPAARVLPRGLHWPGHRAPHTLLRGQGVSPGLWLRGEHQGELGGGRIFSIFKSASNQFSPTCQANTDKRSCEFNLSLPLLWQMLLLELCKLSILLWLNLNLKLQLTSPCSSPRKA